MNCRLCNGSLESRWMSRDAKTSEPLELGMCGECGLVQQVQLPDIDALHTYYTHHYREDYKASHQPKLKHVYRAGLAAKNRLAFMQRAGVLPNQQTLLDIGAGGGEFCYMANKAGFSACGIEPHMGYSEYARLSYDIHIQTGGLAEVNIKPVDVVTLFHVFEHLPQPVAAIECIWNMLSEQGTLVIEVPNIHQADASPHNIYFKAHLFYYSKHSLLTACSQYFELIHLEDRGNLFMALRKRPQPLGQLVLPMSDQIHETRKRLKQKGWLEYLTYGGGAFKPFYRVGKMIREQKLTIAEPRMVLDKIWELQG